MAGARAAVRLGMDRGIQRRQRASSVRKRCGGRAEKRCRQDAFSTTNVVVFTASRGVVDQRAYHAITPHTTITNDTASNTHAFKHERAAALRDSFSYSGTGKEGGRGTSQQRRKAERKGGSGVQSTAC
jgi:hypothetical protein